MSAPEPAPAPKSVPTTSVTITLCPGISRVGVGAVPTGGTIPYATIAGVEPGFVITASETKCVSFRPGAFEMPGTV